MEIKKMSKEYLIGLSIDNKSSEQVYLPIDFFYSKDESKKWLMANIDDYLPNVSYDSGYYFFFISEDDVIIKDKKVFVNIDELSSGWHKLTGDVFDELLPQNEV